MKCQTLSLFSLVHLLKLLTDTVNEKNSMQSMVKKLSMFNIKKKASNAKIRKKYMAQTEQSWLICDGWKCSKAAKLLVSIDTVHSKCINEKINKFVNIFAS